MEKAMRQYKNGAPRVVCALVSMMAMALSVSAQSSTDSGDYSEYILAVDEYVPAPGQFVHVYPEYEDGDDAASMAEKCTEAIANDNGGLVSLGSYGGYITFHFDHSIANVEGEYDFYIAGNAAKVMDSSYSDVGGSCEPGIVMVSRDDNSNGLPDDTWFELSGSADVDSVGKVVYGYEITYSYDPMNDVPWTDNQDNSGVIERNNYHQQEYYPLWLADTTLVFKGTLLPDNAFDSIGDGTLWIQMFLDYGYVDNKPNTDADACSFNIEWAVDENRNPVTLDRIDFVRVYTALNQQCGWIGETSTEVTGAEDLHLEESIAYATGISSVSAGGDEPSVEAYYGVDGTRLASPAKGINIIKMSNGKVKKVIY